MIQRNAEGKVVRNYPGSERIVPGYDGYSIANVPNSISELLVSRRAGKPLDPLYEIDNSLGGAKKIVLFYIDGISYYTAISMAEDSAFFQRLSRNGRISPATAVFPSTTAASCTSLNTGIPPVEHGLIEWQMYFHETGAYMYTLPFKPVTKHYSSRAKQLDPASLFDGRTLFDLLAENGTRAYALLNRNISPGKYSQLLFSKGEVVTYSQISDCMVQLRNLLESHEESMFIYVYLESADSSGHIYGPDSEMYMAEIANISRTIDSELLGKIRNKTAQETGIIVTSDHGQIQTDPENTIYIDSINGIWNSFESHLGEHVPPSGSPRDLFLHAEETRIEEVQSRLADFLGPAAEVITVSDGVKMGFFGSPSSTNSTFMRRAGNLLVLPKSHNTVWFRMNGMSGLNLKGLHGGMTREEMIVPLCTGNLSELI